MMGQVQLRRRIGRNLDPVEEGCMGRGVPRHCKMRRRERSWARGVGQSGIYEWRSGFVICLRQYRSIISSEDAYPLASGTVDPRT